jgi:hypothetical protein
MRPRPCAALLRFGALPIRDWLAGSAPALLAAIADFADDAAAHQTGAGATAARIGELVVPHPALAPRHRVTALAVRRALHRAGHPQAAALRELVGVTEALPGTGDLAATLTALEKAAARLRDRRTELTAAVAEEQHRLLDLPWRLLHGTAAGCAAARSGDLAVYHDIAARVEAHQDWTGKRMRQRSDYLWRMLTRGSTRATPRGWLAHVALLSEEPGGWFGSDPLPVLTDAAADQVDNLDTRRAGAGAGSALLADPDGRVTVAPLCRTEPDVVRVWVVDAQHRGKLREIGLRRTMVLDAVFAALSAGPRAAAELLDELAGTARDRRNALLRFLAHLTDLGVVQVTVPERRLLHGWRPIGDIDAGGQSGQEEFVDVYRRTGTGIDSGHADRLREVARRALGVLALIETDEPDPPGPPACLGAEPRPILEIAAELICDGADVADVGYERPHHHDWPAPRNKDSAYTGLAARLAERFDRLDTGPDGVASVEIDATLLADLDGEPVRRDWPLDVLIRPMDGTAGLHGVLAQVAPAGLLDARFLPAVTGLDGEPPQAGAHRRFLRDRERALGVTTVEVLFPPLHRKAANAVRRPDYTSAWTGDPDWTGYCTRPPGKYLPLAEITLRVADGAALAESGGRRIWPVCHTARVIPPPWDTIHALLMLASGQPRRSSWRSLAYSLPAWPDRVAVPRITLGGLVLTPAQWRVPVTTLWARTDPALDKLLGLVTLRRRLGLPRWCAAVADVHDEPIAVDLDGLLAVRVLDRLAAVNATGTILLTELLPRPDLLPVHDLSTASTCWSELLLRLPASTQPTGPGPTNSPAAGEPTTASRRGTTDNR